MPEIRYNYGLHAIDKRYRSKCLYHLFPHHVRGYNVFDIYSTDIYGLMWSDHRLAMTEFDLELSECHCKLVDLFAIATIHTN